MSGNGSTIVWDGPASTAVAGVTDNNANFDVFSADNPLKPPAPATITSSATAITIVFSANTTATINVVGGHYVITDAAGIDLASAGGVFSNGATTFTANDSVAGQTSFTIGAGSAGTVQLQAPNVIPTTTTVAINAGSLDLNGNSDAIDVLTGSGTVTNSGAAATLTIGSSGGSGLFSGVITDGANAVSLVKTGAGTLTLAGNNTYSGATSILQGIVVAVVNNALGSAAGGTTVSAGAALAFPAAGVDYTTPEPVRLNGNGPTGNGAIESLGGASSFAGPITLNSDSTIGSDDGALTLTGNIDLAAANLTVAGAGDTRLSGAIGGLGDAIEAGLEGQYFASAQLPGHAASTAELEPNTAANASYLGNLTPTISATTPQINFSDIGANSFAPYANVGTSNVAARWVGQIDIPTIGPYDFESASDDGSVVYIDGALVVNNDSFQGAPGNAPFGIPSQLLTHHRACTPLKSITCRAAAAAAKSFPGTRAAGSTSSSFPPLRLSLHAGHNLTKHSAAGTLTLAGNNTYSGATSILQGAVAAVTENNASGIRQSAGATVSARLPLASPRRRRRLHHPGTGQAQRQRPDRQRRHREPGRRHLLRWTDHPDRRLDHRRRRRRLDAKRPRQPRRRQPDQVAGAGDTMASPALHWRDLGDAIEAPRRIGRRNILASSRSFPRLAPRPAPPPSSSPNTTANTSYLGNLTPTVSAITPQINFSDIGANSFAPYANVGTSNIAARWVGQIDIPTIGPYDFESASDDGSVVYIDGALVVNNDSFQGAPGNAPFGSFNFTTTGLHNIEVDYMQDIGGGSEVLSWDPTGGTNFVVVPSSALSVQVNNLTKIGAGTLTLAGNNTYSGATSILQGAVAAAVNNALGSATGGTTVSAGAALAFPAAGVDYTTPEPVRPTRQRPDRQRLLSRAWAQLASAAGPITLNSDSTIGSEGALPRSPATSIPPPLARLVAGLPAITRLSGSPLVRTGAMPSAASPGGLQGQYFASARSSPATPPAPRRA